MFRTLALEIRGAVSTGTLNRPDARNVGYRMARAWEEVPRITLAAIEGYAIGGGLALRKKGASAAGARPRRPR